MIRNMVGTVMAASTGTCRILPGHQHRFAQLLWRPPGAVCVPVTCPIERSEADTHGHSWDQRDHDDLHERWSRRA